MPGYTLSDDGKYSVQVQKKNNRDAANWCKSNGGYLVSINDQDELDTVNAFILNDPFRQDRDEYWLGLSDAAEEGVWKWAVGSEVTVENWNRGEPNDWGHHGEDCAVRKGNGTW